MISKNQKKQLWILLFFNILHFETIVLYFSEVYSSTQPSRYGIYAMKKFVGFHQY